MGLFKSSAAPSPDELPPPYGAQLGPGDAAPPPPQLLPEKEKARPPPPQQQEQPTASTSATPSDLSLSGNGPPISFHIYKAGGVFSRDDLVTGDDKKTILFYLDHPLSFFGSWSMTLHRGGKGGPPVSFIDKEALSSDMLLRMPNGWHTPLVQPGFFSSSHEFTGFDGKTSYKWKRAAMSSDWTLIKKLPNDARQIVAEYRNSVFSISKDGQLLINAGFTNEVELILTSALAVEEWREQQRRRR
ncbi:hypothetical protein BCR35DRAFT_302530 [Leucosporidium creatinivorum]|uniref:Tubby C-terminal-like domain-containing protein n=1 Tax=Leucosporidium creatinivorum TaxID=106004 RepID=A0A1Y2FRX3_9BASI|nr:hypothetical protein BCR35DRAFT_302530 [Leucosporidium creatinivorum]